MQNLLRVRRNPNNNPILTTYVSVDGGQNTNTECAVWASKYGLPANFTKTAFFDTDLVVSVQVMSDPKSGFVARGTYCIT